MKLAQIALLSVTVIISAQAGADILKMPDSAYGVTQGTSSVPRGVSQAHVLKHFGEPSRRYRPVGDPAISSWEYSGFRIYFEDGMVLHTVVSVR
jgi:hypothetical protein